MLCGKTHVFLQKLGKDFFNRLALSAAKGVHSKPGVGPVWNGLLFICYEEDGNYTHSHIRLQSFDGPFTLSGTCAIASFFVMSTIDVE